MKNKWISLKRVIFIPFWLILVLSVVSSVSLAYVFLNEQETSLWAIAAYVISFYTLCVASVYFSLVFPKKYKRIAKRFKDTKYGGRFVSDAVFRTKVTLCCSLMFNLFYAGINLISGFLYDSNWFIIFSFYYGILAVIRFILVRYTRKKDIGNDDLSELKNSRICACILTLVNLFVPSAVLMIIFVDKGFNYPGIMIYVMALYSFYITTVAIINLFKYRKYKSPILSMAKIVTFTAAIVSMLSLETAMFNSFGGEMKESDQMLFIGLTGMGIFVIILAMSVYMIVRSSKEIKKLKTEN